MSTYTATTAWQRDGQPFTDRRYRRQHQWRFDGGAVVVGSSSPQVVTLHPQVRFAGPIQPDAAEIHRLHHAAHAACFIANSVRTDVRCEPVIPEV